MIMTESARENQSQALGTTEVPSEFASLLMQEFKPKTERAREAVETAVRTLAEQALAQTDLVSNDAIKSIESIIAAIDARSEEHTSELQSLMRISYAVFCLTKHKKHKKSRTRHEKQ